MQDLEQTIRERAYHLWVEGGSRDGAADAHWLAAQREILRTSLGEIGRVSVSEQSAKSAKPQKAKASRKKQRAA